MLKLVTHTQAERRQAIQVQSKLNSMHEIIKLSSWELLCLYFGETNIRARALTHITPHSTVGSPCNWELRGKERGEGGGEVWGAD